MPQLSLTPHDQQCTCRHLAYNTENFTLDLRMDFSEGSVRLFGQLVQAQGVAMPDVPAFLLNGDRLVARALTGAFGEFQIECACDDGLRLSLALDDDDLIEVELARPRRRTSDSPALMLDALTPARATHGPTPDATEARFTVRASN